MNDDRQETPNPGYKENPQEESTESFNNNEYGQEVNKQNTYYGSEDSGTSKPKKKNKKLLAIGLSILVVLGLVFVLGKSGLLPGSASPFERMVENTLEDFEKSTIDFFGQKAAKVVDSAKENMEFKLKADTPFDKINFTILNKVKEKMAELNLDAVTEGKTYKLLAQAKGNDLYLSMPEAIEKAIQFDATKLGKQLIESGLVEDEESKKQIEDLSLNLWSRSGDSDLSYKHTLKQLSKMAKEEGKSSKEFQIAGKYVELDLKKLSLDMKQVPELIEAIKEDVKKSAVLKGNEESIQKYLDKLKTEFEESNKSENKEMIFEYAQYQGKLAYGNLYFKGEEEVGSIKLTFKGKKNLTDEFILKVIDDGKESYIEKTMDISKDKRTMNFNLRADNKDMGSAGIELDYANKKFSILAGKTPILMGDIISEKDRIGLSISGKSMGLPIDLNIEMTLGKIKSDFSDLPKDVQKAEEMKKEDWKVLLEVIQDKLGVKKKK